MHYPTKKQNIEKILSYKKMEKIKDYMFLYRILIHVLKCFNYMLLIIVIIHVYFIEMNYIQRKKNVKIENTLLQNEKTSILMLFVFCVNVM